MATQAQLDEARAAYHSLQTGTMARVFVDQNGERVEFVAAKKTDLYNYIQQLESELGVSTPTRCPARPMRFLF
jgi:membrane protease subunit (stomatin/prohibitin family)